MGNDSSAILAYFASKNPDADIYPKNAGKRFCNGFLAFCNRVAFEHAGEASGKYLIAPFGDWKNGDIVQRVDASAAENLKRNMLAVWAKVKSDIENPCPVHYEHPDDEDGKEVPKVVDKTPYGRVRSLEICDDGIYAEIEWLPGFETLPKSLQISPRWNANPLGGGIVRPVRLISIGLTQRPNIRHTAFVNSTTQQKEAYMDKEILTLLGYTEEEIQKIIDKAEGAPTDVLTRIKKALSDKATLENELIAAKGETAEKEKEAEEAKQQLANSQAALKAAQAARAKLVVANAVRTGKIAEFQRSSAEAILANSEDFESEEKKIAEAPSVIKTASKTDGIEKSEKERTKSQQDAQAKFAIIVKQKQKSGIDYNSAWNLAKSENAELFEAAYPSNV